MVRLGGVATWWWRPGGGVDAGILLSGGDETELSREERRVSVGRLRDLVSGQGECFQL